MADIYHVMIKQGDAVGEVDRALEALKGREEAGFHKYMFVTQAKQTVLMLTSRESPLAADLRGRGWTEPGDKPLRT
jgi:hypothetical protein